MNNNYPAAVEKIVNNYLDRLKKHLRSLPDKDKEELLKEVQSHIFESYTSDSTKDDVDRIFNVLIKLGEPGEVFAQRMPDQMVKMGKERKLPLYILSGILIALFGIPIGATGVGLLLAAIFTILGLLVAFFATAISFIIAGFCGMIASVIYIIDPLFLDHLFNDFSFGLNHLQWASPIPEGILGLVGSMILAGVGILLLFLGRYIFRGIRFLFQVTMEKIKEFIRKRRRK